MKENFLYVLFPYGEVIEFDNDEEENIYEIIFNEIMKIFYEKEIDKIILTGHSMGCCLALRFSIYLQENKLDFYNKFIYVIGSGAYNCIEKSKDLINEENKIFILYNTMKISDNNEYDGFIDSYIFQNKEKYKLPSFIYIIDISNNFDLYVEYIKKREDYKRKNYNNIYKLNTKDVINPAKAKKKKLYPNPLLHDLRLYKYGVNDLNV